MRFKQRYVFCSSDADGATGGATIVDPAAQTSVTADPAAASLLSTGAADPVATTTDYFPEKLRVMKEDGTFDLDASSRKLAEAYGHAEKRIGSGDIAPKTAEEYAVVVPDAFKEVWKPEEDQSFKYFRAKAHEAGITQKQLDVVMGQYFEMAPKLVAGAQQYDANTATAELKTTWATEADFNRNVRNAYVGATAIAGKAGINIGKIMEGPLGNNPTFLRLMAAIGPEFQEDAPPGGQQMQSVDDIDKLMISDAYRDSKHVDHAKVSAQVKKYFERKHGTEAAV